MKKVISFATSFLLGFAFFVAGGAIASETEVPASETSQTAETSQDPVVEGTVEEQVTEVETSPTTGEASTSTDAHLTQETAEAASVSGGDVYCFQIGKATELDGDCFCVQDIVSTMAEVDCLIASGVVPASSYESYRQFVLGE
jgi:hypothetical protein